MAVPKMPSRLVRLDVTLATLPTEEAMTLPELDGYLAGLLIGPEPIPPEEWLPWIWGGGDAPFEDAAEQQWFTTMVTNYRAEIARALTRGKFQPLHDVGPRHGDVMWDAWIRGFDQAMTLRPDGWDRIADGGGDDRVAAMSGLMLLRDIADERPIADVSIDLLERMDEAAPALIPAWVAVLCDGSPLHDVVAIETEPAAPKIGRNDPCSCGSGKKWKKCCGSHA